METLHEAMIYIAHLVPDTAFACEGAFYFLRTSKYKLYQAP